MANIYDSVTNISSGQIKNIGIKNFRVFKDDTFFDFAPLTILTGANSSGKSSVIKLLRLICDSYKIDENLRQLYFSGNTNHKLGSIKNCISHDSENDEIVISNICHFFGQRFNIKRGYIPNFDGFAENGALHFFEMANENETIFRLELDISIDSSDPKVENYLIKEFINYKFIFHHYFKSLISDLEKVKYYLKKSKEKSLLSYPIKSINKMGKIIEILEKEGIYENRLGNLEKLVLNGDFSVLSLNDFSEDIFELSNDTLYQKHLTKDLYTIGVNLTEKDRILRHFTSDYILYMLERFFNSNIIPIISHDNYKVDFFNELFLLIKNNIRYKIKADFKDIEFLSSTRGNNERLLLDNSNSQISDILIEFFSLNINENSPEYNFVEHWIKEFEIGEKLEIKREYEYIASQVFVIKNKRRVSLADLGFGVNQMLPVLLQIAITANKHFDAFLYAIDGYISPSVIVIEEPESNLHPSFQSKMAEMFVDANKQFNIQFIIETHSEYLIRKLQYLTAKKVIKTSDTQIYYFHSPDKVPEGEDQVKKINIENSGALTKNFGKGFFDEASNLNISLYDFS